MAEKKPLTLRQLDRLQAIEAKLDAIFQTVTHDEMRWRLDAAQRALRHASRYAEGLDD